MHKAFVIADIDTSKEQVERVLNKQGIRCVVLDEEYESTTGYTNYTVLVDNRSFEKFFDVFREPAEIRSNFITRLGVELDLEPMTMFWLEEDEDDGEFGDPPPVLSMNVWLHEPSGIAFVDKAGTIRVRDLDIETQGYDEEKFEPREV